MFLSDDFNTSEVAIRLVLSIGLGLLVGFEREWSRKDLGVRIFAITALLGTLSALVAESFALGAMAAVALLIIFVNGRNLKPRKRVLTQSRAASTSRILRRRRAPTKRGALRCFRRVPGC